MTNSSASVTMSPDLTQDEIVDIAKQAFIYGFPLVVMDITKEQFTNVTVPSSAGAPINQFSNKSQFPTPADTTVVRPNCDTYYSIAFLNLLEEPLILGIPATDEQYYMMPLLDAFTNVIPGSPGKRTGETEGGQYLIVGPNHDVPSGTDISQFTDVIHSPTNLVWALGRFQVDNTDEQDMQDNGAGKVMALQSQLIITTIAGDTPSTGVPPHSIQTGSANSIVAAMDIKDFFAQLNALLITNPPTLEDKPAMELYAKIGVGTEWAIPFNEMTFDADTMSLLEEIPLSMIQELTTEGNSGSVDLDDWSYNIDRKMADYGVHYHKRALIACIGFGANLIEDAVYYNTGVDSTGLALNGLSNKYTLNFDELPPVDGFWSLTMYDNAGNLYANEINRYVVGHSDEYRLNPSNPSDGPTIIYIQNEAIAQDDDRFNNWLPAPATPFTLLLRAYDPTDGLTGPIITGVWTPPAVVKSDN